MKVIRLDVYKTIALVDVEFDEHGTLQHVDKLFECSLCPSNVEIEQHTFLDNYVAHYCSNLVHSDICQVPKHPFRHAFLKNQEEYRGCIYVSKRIESNCTIVPCTQDDVDTISQYVSDFQDRFATQEEKGSMCTIS